MGLTLLLLDMNKQPKYKVGDKVRVIDRFNTRIDKIEVSDICVPPFMYWFTADDGKRYWEVEEVIELI